MKTIISTPKAPAAIGHWFREMLRLRQDRQSAI